MEVQVLLLCFFILSLCLCIYLLVCLSVLLPLCACLSVFFLAFYFLFDYFCLVLLPSVVLFASYSLSPSSLRASLIPSLFLPHFHRPFSPPSQSLLRIFLPFSLTNHPSPVLPYFFLPHSLSFPLFSLPLSFSL